MCTRADRSWGARLALTAACLGLLVLAPATRAEAQRPGKAGKGEKAAAPTGGAAAHLTEAKQALAQGDYARATAAIDAGLAAAPDDLGLLQLRAQTRLEQRDFDGALAAYEAYLAADPKGANRRSAEKIVRNLQAVKTTFLDITVDNGPASVYLDSRSFGVFCVAGNQCRKGLPPGTYKLIIEREGHERATERFTIDKGKTATFTRRLVEKPSPATITVRQPGALVVVDGKPLGPAPQQLVLTPGEHRVEVSLDGHVPLTETVVAREGKTLVVELSLAAIVPMDLPVKDATLTLDGAPAKLDGVTGGLVVPGDGKVHVLGISARGFRDGTFEIPADRPAGYRVAPTLRPAPGHLELRNAPRGAIVRVDGKTVGVTPLAEPIELEPGEHAIEVEARGYRPFRGATPIAPEGKVDLTVTQWQRAGKRKAWIATAAAGVSLAAGVGFGVLALRAEEDYAALAGKDFVQVGDPRLADYKAAGERWSLLSDVSIGAALISAGLAGWWFWSEGQDLSEGRFKTLVGPGTVGVAGSF